MGQKHPSVQDVALQYSSIPPRSLGWQVLSQVGPQGEYTIPGGHWTAGKRNRNDNIEKQLQKRKQQKHDAETGININELNWNISRRKTFNVFECYWI